MTCPIFCEATLFGVIGGIATILLNLWEMARMPKSQRPDLRDFVYLIGTVIAPPVLGGILACAYQCSGIDLKPIVALNIGVSAPLIIRSMLNVSKLPVDPGSGA